MKITVSVAYTDAALREAFALLYQIYLNVFKVDLKELKRLFPLDFRSVVLLVKDETGKLLGTASLMYPHDIFFPTEYLFGATIRNDGVYLPLRGGVEVGRLAKADDAPSDLVSKAIMLGVAAYIRKENLSGWVATVKPPMYRIIKRTGLQSVLFETYLEETDEEKAAIIEKYKGKEIKSFWASAEDTIHAFERLASEKIVVEI